MAAYRPSAWEKPPSRLVWIIHRLISVVSPFTHAGLRVRRTGLAELGIWPVVLSSGSGLATRIPAISRPSMAALTATLASWSAVAAPG